LGGDGIVVVVVVVVIIEWLEALELRLEPGVISLQLPSGFPRAFLPDGLVEAFPDHHLSAPAASCFASTGCVSWKRCQSATHAFLFVPLRFNHPSNMSCA